MNDNRQRLPLSTLAPQTQATIISIHCQGPVKRRLMDMGLTPGTRVFIEGTAPFGDPMILWARGCRLAIRRIEAAQVSVEVCPEAFIKPTSTWTSPRLPRVGHRHRWGRRGHGKGRGGWKGNRGR